MYKFIQNAIEIGYLLVVVMVAIFGTMVVLS